MRTFEMLEGLIDLKTNIKYSTNNNHREDTSTKVIYTMKPGITTFKHASLGNPSSVIAIDLGLGGELITTDLYNTYQCGEEVTVFYSTDETIDITTKLGTMLSNVDKMEGSLPIVSYLSTENIKILNENFINIGGIFEYIQISGSSDFLTFSGSTFKTAPRIIQRLDEYFSFPSIEEKSRWEPFKGCPNIERIEYQGDFGDKLEFIGPVNFTYKDANGIEKIDAYPQGGNPRIIDNYIDIETYTLGASGKFPVIGTELLTFAINPVNIKYIDPTYSQGETSEVIGININNSPNLKIISLELPKLLIEDTPYMFGAKAFGYDFNTPNLEEIRGNLFGIENSIEERIIEGERIIGYPIFTPQWISTHINSSWGTALKKLFDDDEPLLAPNINSNQIKVISNYYSRNTKGNKGPFFVPTANGLTGFTIPPLPETTEIIDGYCENLYEGSFFCTDFPIEFNGSIVNATHHATIPPLPESIKVSRNYLYETFKNAFGEGEIIEIGESDKRNLTAFYGTQMVDRFYEGQTLFGIINCTPSNPLLNKIWSTEDNHRINLVEPFTLNAPVSPEDAELDMQLLIEKVFGSTENRPTELRNYTINEGITLTPNGSLPLMEYAINWQTRTWYGSTVNPTIISTLQPLNSFVKSENAYSEVLVLDYLNPQGAVRRLTLSTGYNDDDTQNYRNIVLIGTDASVPILTDDIKNELSYDINDVITPPNFFIQNEDSQIYDSLFNAFNFLFYGDFKTWVIEHGGGDPDFETTLKYLTGTDKLERRSGSWGAGDGNNQEGIIVFNAREVRGEASFLDNVYYVYAGTTTNKQFAESLAYMPSTYEILTNDLILPSRIALDKTDISIDVSDDGKANTVIESLLPAELNGRTF